MSRDTADELSPETAASPCDMCPDTVTPCSNMSCDTVDELSDIVSDPCHTSPDTATGPRGMSPDTAVESCNKSPDTVAELRKCWNGSTLSEDTEFLLSPHEETSSNLSVDTKVISEEDLDISRNEEINGDHIRTESSQFGCISPYINNKSLFDSYCCEQSEGIDFWGHQEKGWINKESSTEEEEMVQKDFEKKENLNKYNDMCYPHERSTYSSIIASDELILQML